MVDIIFEDDDLLVIDKPPRLVVTPSQTQKEKTLAEILKEDYGIDLERGGVVHRLDKDTSGALLVAKTQQALENLQAQFKQRKVKKEYLALVHGWIKEAGKVEGAISRNPLNREKFMVLTKGVYSTHPKGVQSGKEAVTEYLPISNFKFQISNLFFKLPSAEQSIFNDLNKIQMRKLERMNYNQFTLVRCFPRTGRTHQIRVHLKYIHHPIVCDASYVGRKMFRLDKRWCPRIFLHAEKIGFRHPKSGKWMQFQSPLPNDLKNVLTNLKS